ncbi:MAG TPA: 30S ribosomal protein S12 methylthiotransferase RimO [Myxococcota bacterium]|nr:30S ribosomal protein S12 methylthiotransferase RimO [Myxococcota bacterium]
MEPRKVHVVSLGCPKARVDTEVMLGLAKQGGWVLTDDPAEADALVVNTCSFLESAVKESVDTILELGQHKAARPGTRLVVTGCLPSRYGAELVDELPEVDTFLGTSDIHRIGEALGGELPDRAYIRQGYSHLYEGIDDARVTTTRGATAFLKLAEGCNRTCTFCVIPAIRGRQRSRPIEAVVEEARRLAGAGIQELVLVAQDLTSYGTDLGDRRSLVRLLRELEQVDVRWVRLMYAYPWNFTDELLDLVASSDKVVRYVDMPLQHVNARVLADMRRNIQRDAQRRLIARLREIDGMVLRTTFITGFPGETDAEFRELVDWVEEVQFDRVGVFAYSQEAGTPAGDREDQVPKRVREARRKELLGVQQGIHRARLASLVGRTFDVLVDGPSEEHGWVLEGRYYGQAPDIDGVVALSVEDPDAVVEPGRFVRATITAASEYDLVGTVGAEG